MKEGITDVVRLTTAPFLIFFFFFFLLMELEETIDIIIQYR